MCGRGNLAMDYPGGGGCNTPSHNIVHNKTRSPNAHDGLESHPGEEGTIPSHFIIIKL